MSKKKMKDFPKDSLSSLFEGGWGGVPIKTLWKDHLEAVKTEKWFQEYLAKNEQKIKLIPINSLMGIEVEVENVVSGNTRDYASFLGWKPATDGSLRNNGVEFISGALSSKECEVSLAALWSCFDLQKGEPVSFDWRSSFHVHLNVREKNVDFLLKLILVYSIFESSLFDLAGPERKKSNFCIPLNSTDLHFYISSCINSQSSFYSVIEQWTKYSALNLRSVLTYGTIEFRQMEGTGDLRRISDWLNVVFSLFNYAEKTTVTELIGYISSLNTTSLYEDFKRRVFGDYHYLLSSPESHKKMREGILFAKLCLSTNPKKRMYVESAYLRRIEERNQRRRLDYVFPQAEEAGLKGGQNFDFNVGLDELAQYMGDGAQVFVGNKIAGNKAI